MHNLAPSVSDKLMVLLFLSGCASLPENIEPLPVQFALPPATTGLLAEVDATIVRSRAPGHSGFRLLEKNIDGRTWRLELIDAAVSSLDLMYYLWYDDVSGLLMLKHVIDAAERGVKVRMIVDDLLLIGNDRTLVALDEHPNIQFRIFNPWTNRQAGRGVEFLTRMSQLNSRMHNKLLIADNHATILGGRNIGDHYFGLSEDYNFYDLDVLGVGPVARQASGMFDHFWNSSWVISASILPAEVDDQFVADKSRQFEERLQRSRLPEEYFREPIDRIAALTGPGDQLQYGSSEFVYDRIENDERVSGMPEKLSAAFKTAEQEVLLVNAYVIPDQNFIDGIRRMADEGVVIHILTNSLASHDVPAVNSHYQQWRRPILEAGAQLYELRPDPAIKSLVDTAPVVSKFVGLHTKAFVVDRRVVFIGSMNFDPRSVDINSEMGVIIESDALGKELADIMVRDMDPANSWQVEVDAAGKLMWVNSEQTLTRQPARNMWQRVMDGFFKLFPKSQF